jgi:hypothetical protein
LSHQQVEAEKLKGEREIQKMRDEFELDQAIKQEAHIMDYEKFIKAQFEQDAPKRAAQEQADKRTFLDGYNTLRSFSNNMANWNVVHSTLGPGFRVYDLEQALASNAISLSKPSQAEIDSWANQDIARRNAELKAMDIPTLKKEMLREQAENRAATNQREENALLEDMRQRDAQLNLPPLPTHDQNGVEISAAYLKRLLNTDMARYKYFLKRWGGYAMTLRLQGRA